MSRYVLSSAVITAPGVYSYHLITPEQIRAWIEKETYISKIGYVETAQALESMCGHLLEVDRTQITMAPGDEALVFRLAPPPGAQRPDDRVKGRLTPAFIRRWCEVGILIRMS
jgi:hypothetical protein